MCTRRSRWSPLRCCTRPRLVTVDMMCRTSLQREDAQAVISYAVSLSLRAHLECATAPSMRSHSARGDPGSRQAPSRPIIGKYMRYPWRQFAVQFQLNRDPRPRTVNTRQTNRKQADCKRPLTNVHRHTDPSLRLPLSFPEVHRALPTEHMNGSASSLVARWTSARRCAPNIAYTLALLASVRA